MKPREPLFVRRSSEVHRNGDPRRILKLFPQHSRIPASYWDKASVKSMHACKLSCISLFVTPWIVCSPLGSPVHGIFQIRILSELLFPSPGDLPDLGIKPASPALLYHSATREVPYILINSKESRRRNSYQCE